MITARGKLKSYEDRRKIIKQVNESIELSTIYSTQKYLSYLRNVIQQKLKINQIIGNHQKVNGPLRHGRIVIVVRNAQHFSQRPTLGATPVIFWISSTRLNIRGSRKQLDGGGNGGSLGSFVLWQ
jgi:hypothetical protein